MEVALHFSPHRYCDSETRLVSGLAVPKHSILVLELDKVWNSMRFVEIWLQERIIKRLVSKAHSLDG